MFDCDFKHYLQVLGAGLLEKPLRESPLPHQCTLCGGPDKVSSAGCRGSSERAVSGLKPGPQFLVQPGPGLAQQYDTSSAYQVSSSGVALV